MSETSTVTQAEQRTRVVAEALTWLGTPYHHHGRIKGQGVDCLMLLAEVFERCGLVERVEPGNYATDWHLHRNEEAYMHGLMGYTRQLPDGQGPQPGDIALFRFGRTYSHAGIVTQPGPSLRFGGAEIVHAYLRRGVILSRLAEEPLAGRPIQFWSHW